MDVWSIGVILFYLFCGELPVLLEENADKQTNARQLKVGRERLCERSELTPGEAGCGEAASVLGESLRAGTFRSRTPFLYC